MAARTACPLEQKRGYRREGRRASPISKPMNRRSHHPAMSGPDQNGRLLTQAPYAPLSESVDWRTIDAGERATGGSNPPAESKQSPPRGLRKLALQPLQRAFSDSAGRFDRPAVRHRRATRVLLVVLLLLAPFHAALAHSFEPALMDLSEREPGIFEVRWRLPGAESGALAFGAGDLTPQLPPHCRVVATAAPSTWRADCGLAGLRGATLSVRGIEASRIDVIVRVSWRDGETISGAVYPAAPEFVVPGGRAASDASVARVAWSYLGLGAEHILLGYDHLLFVLGLMLLVDSWSMLLKTISAFTVAHSVTLAAAVLGLVHVPPAPVEALIAMSIVLLALELTRPLDTPPTLARRYPWMVAFVFGLLHGLGFAGALAEIGVPSDRIALALVSFNLGVEAGQLAFVLAVLAPLALARRLTQRWPQAHLVPAYAIGALAMAWTFERLQRFWL